jgi:hypothetical protein
MPNSISKNRFRKTLIFEKYFPKIIYEGKIGFSEGWKNYWGEEEKNSNFSLQNYNGNEDGTRDFKFKISCIKLNSLLLDQIK